MGQENSIDFRSSVFVGRLTNRDPDAIESVVRAYTEHLYKGALGLGFDSNIAREIVQSVWVTFYDVVPKFEAKSHVRTFLFGILYNKASEQRREQKKSHNHDPIEDVVEARFDENGKWTKPPIDPESFILATENMKLIEHCLDGLPLTQRMAFCLKEIDDHDSPDICNILNVTVTNLGVLLFRARNRLRECIEGKARP
ncbi:MAG: hypothetical protein A2X86_12555 [Bdellovibrionales bacterium GWA2_49_15]|nr:MAG: hypothetical protein A2X86_12555 [Bdellovibrionales bacterium GWA2_49_15]HAZ14683.1 hypothetical protein [Bdellovibrionales bacterium]